MLFLSNVERDYSNHKKNQLMMLGSESSYLESISAKKNEKLIN